MTRWRKSGGADKVKLFEVAIPPGKSEGDDRKKISHWWAGE